MVDYLDELRGDNTTVDLTYTYHMSKYSCIHAFFSIHIWLNYIILWVGVLCFVSRAVPQMKWMHAFLGRVYISAMLLTTFASLLVHNTGLALAIIMAFVNCMLGLIPGWFIIKQHQNQMTDKALALVDSWIKEDKLGGRSLAAAMNDAKAQIAKAKTWVQRFISYKAAHGILMTLSWFQIAGRFLATGAPDDEFTCYTYPIYKPVNSPIYQTKGMDLESMPLKDLLVPIDHPTKPPLGSTFPGGEWGWMAILAFTPVLMAVLVGVGFSMWAARREREALTKDVSDTSVQLVEASIGG